jgi:hypothetical protein
MGQQNAKPRVIAPPRPLTQPMPVSRTESPELCDELDAVPVMFKWTHGGQRVNLTGTFNNWASEGIPMVRSGQEFYQVVQVSKGVHEYKFLVDGEWKFSLDQPVLQDVSGNVNNVVDIQYYEKYEPAPLKDPLDVEDLENEWGQEVLDALQTEPPTAPPLLVKLPLLGIPSGRKSETIKILNPHNPSNTSASHVNIPLFSVCGHVMHDASGSFRGIGGDAVIATACIRFAQKFSTTVVVTLNNSPRSDGLLRHYGILTPTAEEKPSGSSTIFHRALLGKKRVTFNQEMPSPTHSEASGILRRANSSGSESPGRTYKNIDVSTFTD